MTEHTVTSYDEELKGLAVKLSQMGGHAEKVLNDSIMALQHHDQALALRTIEADDVIDKLEEEVEEQAVLMIAKRQPMAELLQDGVDDARHRVSSACFEPPTIIRIAR